MFSHAKNWLQFATFLHYNDGISKNMSLLPRFPLYCTRQTDDTIKNDWLEIVSGRGYKNR